MLTATQGSILAAIRAHTAEHGHPPTLREIGHRAGLSSPSTIGHHVKSLAERGYLTYTPGISRSIRLTSGDPIPGPLPPRPPRPPKPTVPAEARRRIRTLERQLDRERAKVAKLERDLATQCARTKRARDEAVALQHTLDAFYAPDPQP